MNEQWLVRQSRAWWDQSSLCLAQGQTHSEGQWDALPFNITAFWGVFKGQLNFSISFFFSSFCSIWFMHITTAARLLTVFFFFFFPCSSVQQPTSRSPGCMLMIALEKDRLKIKWILVQSYFCFIGESSRKKMNKKLLLQLPLKIKLGNLLWTKHRTNERPPSSPPLGEAHQL